MNFEKEKNPYIHTVYYTGFFFQSPCMQFNAAWVSYLLNIFFCPRGRSQTTFLVFTYLPLVYIYEEIRLLLYRENLHTNDISITTYLPTYLVLT